MTGQRKNDIMYRHIVKLSDEDVRQAGKPFSIRSSGVVKFSRDVSPETIDKYIEHIDWVSIVIVPPSCYGVATAKASNTRMILRYEELDKFIKDMKEDEPMELPEPDGYREISNVFNRITVNRRLLKVLKSKLSISQADVFIGEEIDPQTFDKYIDHLEEVIVFVPSKHFRVLDSLARTKGPNVYAVIELESLRDL